MEPSVRQIAAAQELALARAHVEFPEVLELERRVPQWIRHLATDAGVRRFEERHGIPLPNVLQQYYQSTRLICLLQAAWDVYIFLQDMRGADPPEVKTWNGTPHVVIGYFPHSDSVCGAELSGDRQTMYWEGWSLVQSGLPAPTLSEWVFGAATRLLMQGIPPPAYNES